MEFLLLVIAASVPVIAVLGVSVFRTRRRALLRHELRAAYAGPRVRCLDLLAWREDGEEHQPDAMGLLCESADGTFTLVLRRVTPHGAPLGAAPTETPIVRGEAKLGALVRTDRWCVPLACGAERWRLAPASGTSADTLALRDTLARFLGVEMPARAYGELPVRSPRERLTEIAVGLATIASVFSLIALLDNNAWRDPALIFTPPLLAVAGLALLWRTRRRRGRVELYGDRIVLIREREVTVGWSDVRAFDDSALDLVQLQGVEGWPLSDLAIPTPDEGARTEVLALLDRRGLRRIEG